MLKINRTDGITNDEVFEGRKKNEYFKKNRRHLWIGHIIRHNDFVVNILEEAVSGLQYLNQVAGSTGADNYTAMKRMGYSKSRCKAAKQSKELKDKKNPTTNVF
jgi:hypothetical protein